MEIFFRRGSSFNKIIIGVIVSAAFLSTPALFREARASGPYVDACKLDLPTWPGTTYPLNQNGRPTYGDVFSTGGIVASTGNGLDGILRIPDPAVREKFDHLAALVITNDDPNFYPPISIGEHLLFTAGGPTQGKSLGPDIDSLRKIYNDMIEPASGVSGFNSLVPWPNQPEFIHIFYDPDTGVGFRTDGAAWGPNGFIRNYFKDSAGVTAQGFPVWWKGGWSPPTGFVSWQNTQKSNVKLSGGAYVISPPAQDSDMPVPIQKHITPTFVPPVFTPAAGDYNFQTHKYERTDPWWVDQAPTPNNFPPAWTPPWCGTASSSAVALSTPPASSTPVTPPADTTGNSSSSATFNQTAAEAALQAQLQAQQVQQAQLLSIQLQLNAIASLPTGSNPEDILSQLQEIQKQLAGIVQDNLQAAGGSVQTHGGAAVTNNTGANPPSLCHSFTTNLKQGDSGSEVAALQDKLEREKFSIPDSELKLSGNFFGPGTLDAVKKFQLKYKSDILDKIDSSVPTGYFGPFSRAKMNSLYPCSDSGAGGGTTGGGTSGGTTGGSGGGSGGGGAQSSGSGGFSASYFAGPALGFYDENDFNKCVASQNKFALGKRCWLEVKNAAPLIITKFSCGKPLSFDISELGEPNQNFCAGDTISAYVPTGFKYLIKDGTSDTRDLASYTKTYTGPAVTYSIKITDIYNDNNSNHFGAGYREERALAPSYPEFCFLNGFIKTQGVSIAADVYKNGVFLGHYGEDFLDPPIPNLLNAAIGDSYFVGVYGVKGNVCGIHFSDYIVGKDINGIAYGQVGGLIGVKMTESPRSSWSSLSSLSPSPSLPECNSLNCGANFANYLCSASIGDKSNYKWVYNGEQTCNLNTPTNDINFCPNNRFVCVADNASTGWGHWEAQGVPRVGLDCQVDSDCTTPSGSKAFCLYGDQSRTNSPNFRGNCACGSAKVNTLFGEIVTDQVSCVIPQAGQAPKSATLAFSPSKASYCVGDAVTWTVNSDPLGLKAYLNRKRNGLLDIDAAARQFVVTTNYTSPSYSFNASDTGNWELFYKVDAGGGLNVDTNTFNTSVKDCSVSP